MNRSPKIWGLDLKALRILAGAITLVLCIAAETLPAEEAKTFELKPTEKPPEEKVTGNASIGFYNRYIFRGYEIGKSGLVIQPSLTASFKGLSVTLWGNVDTNQRNTTSAVFSNEGRKGWDETDLTLSYTYTIQKLSLTGGYIHYSLKYAEDTEELFVAFAYDTLTKPTFSIYQDINSYPGTYMNLSFAHSFALPKDITLDLGASFGYFMGQGNYWKTYETATGDYTGSKYKGFHDGMVKTGLTVPITKAFVIQPSVAYWFPLSGTAKKTYGYNPATGLRIPYNPNGYVTDNLVYGVGFTYSF
ncbi:MAG: hypothetical protein NTX36_15995 [Proteobacteria bacterium]|nr:hypothetical protein [Pseudomonadota bacterium]